MEAHLNDFLVRHTSQEDILFVLVWMEFDTIWSLAVAKPLDALACLRVPELHLSIIPAGQEPSTVV